MELKAEFSAGRIQAYPDFDSDEPFILTTDWSSLNIAGVLSQKQDRVERFLGCWGQKCNRYERHYSSAKGELLALVKCMKKYKKGSEKVNADALSRAKHLDKPTTEENQEYQEANEVGEMKITFASELEGNPVEIGKGRRNIRLLFTT